jgi:hypothetical protein
LSADLVSPFQVISITLIRYILVLSKIKDNKNAKIILDYIIMNNINRQLSNTIATDIDRPHIGLAKGKIDFVTDFIQTRYFNGNRFTDNEVDDVLLSILKVLDVPCDILKMYTDIGRYYQEIDDETGNPLFPAGGYFMDVFRFTCKYLIQYKISEKYGLRFDIYNLRLESGRIIESKIDRIVKKGSPVHIFVKIAGFVKNAYFDLLIVDPKNKKSWYPDPSSWDSGNDKGTLNLEHGESSSKWAFTIPVDSRLGVYKALIVLYEVEILDKNLVEKLKGEINGIAEKNKHVLDFQEISFTVTT